MPSSTQPAFSDISGTATGGQMAATVAQTNQSNTYTAGPQDLSAQALTMQVANDTTTGTTANLLAKLTSTGVIKAATVDSAIPVYICRFRCRH